MVQWFAEERLITDSDPMVSAMENAGNPHYLPTAVAVARRSTPTSWCCSISGAKLDRQGAVFADITWVGYTGRHVPERYARAFSAVASARDAAIALVQTRGSRGPRPSAAGRSIGRPRRC